MAEISDLLEFLRSKHVSTELENVRNKIDNNVLESRLTLLYDMRNKLISCLKINYWDDITILIAGVYTNKSKYNYIIDGVDFLSHIRTRTTNVIYLYICELYSIQETIQSLESEKRKRINYIELNIDEEMRETCREHDQNKKPKTIVKWFF